MPYIVTVTKVNDDCSFCFKDETQKDSILHKGKEYKEIKIECRDIQQGLEMQAKRQLEEYILKKSVSIEVKEVCACGRLGAYVRLADKEGKEILDRAVDGDIGNRMSRYFII